MNEFVVCVDNSGHEGSLEVWKIYRVLPATEKEKRAGVVRVVDESGEDYLYPERFFSAVMLPEETRERLRAAG